MPAHSRTHGRRPPLRWRVAHRFTSYSRQRGSEMARERGVDVEQGSATHALARVRDGPSLFVVQLVAIDRNGDLAELRVGRGRAARAFDLVRAPLRRVDDLG